MRLIKQAVSEYEYPQWTSEGKQFSVIDCSASWSSGAAYAKTRGAKYKVVGMGKVYRTNTLADAKWWIGQQ
jgi:hypothetical protein